MSESPLKRNSKSNLERLLQEMLDRPASEAEITREIEEEFGETRAVLALDMSGFSRTTQRRGIVAFLLMIHQMKRIARPVIEANDGIVVKAEADNLFCLLETTTGAIKAAREIIGRLETVNLVLPEDRRLYASIGIGWGRILNVDERDLFGDEVNLASKLGEDVAEKNQILLTQAAQAIAAQSGLDTREASVSISGLTLNYYQLV
ncbi:MAG TPA: adenylate/guanylate cyclase domain-containing protein [Allosphingosinicella sp.]|uniref:adenylate/guanylate cyclase domain-containing protein n=1 Tax=Allosphingosinicella sp. TaxID=2823234 RepID=UPI002F2A060C